MNIKSPRVIRNYSYDHSTNHYTIRYKGKYYGCCKTEQEAIDIVKAYKDCDWNLNMKKDILKKYKR